jgi:NitT/TauT family transport system ATP-binding protein
MIDTSPTVETRAPVADVHAAPVLSARDVTLRLPGERGRDPVLALDDVTLEVPAGQFVCLVGASGCGKTSLLNLFAGHLAATEGDVRVAGRPPVVGDPTVGYMFAKDNLMPWRTAARNVELALERGSQSRRERRERARELLALVGLGGFEDAYPRELSHGMRQRCALARTLAPDPEVLLMDEPLAALDARTKLRMQAELLRILDQAGGAKRKTVVFVTHDLQEALLLGDRVVVMLPRPGRIAQDRLSGLPRDRAGQLGETMFTDRFRALHEELFHLLEAGS